MKIADLPPPPAQGRAPAYLATTARPLSFQAESGEIRRPWAVSRSRVPPTAVTRGSEAGQSTTGCGAEQAAGFRGPRDPEVVGGGQHGDVVPVSAEVGVAQLRHGGPAREVLLRDAEALADHVAQIVGDHVVLRGHELREATAGEGLGGGRLDQQDAGPGARAWAASTSLVVSPAASTMSGFFAS